MQRTYSIIGTGNMAWFLATGLSNAGWSCRGIYGRQAEAALELAAVAHTVPLQAIADIPDCKDHICFLAVSDQAISNLAAHCAFRDTVLVHTSGAAALDLLDAAANRAVLWPVYSIIRGHLPAHRRLPLAYEANTPLAGALVQAVAGSLSDIVFEAGDAQRRQLHLSAVFANNFINHLMAIAEQLCREHQLPFDYLKPILQQTFDRAAGAGPEAVQSGPARRGDEATMAVHRALLSAHPDWVNVYESLSASIKKMYRSDKE